MSKPPYDYEPQTQSPDDLAKLQKMCDAVLLLTVQRDEQKAALAKTEEQIKTITEKMMPEVMGSLRIKHIGTDSGVSVRLEERIHAALPSEKTSPMKRQQVLNAVRKSGNDGLIKTVFKVSYGRNAAGHVARFRKVLHDNGIGSDAVISLAESIHHSTYIKFVRDLAKANPELNLSDFGGYRKVIATIEV